MFCHVHATSGKMEARIVMIAAYRNFPLKMHVRSATTLKTLQRAREKRGMCVCWCVRCAQQHYMRSFLELGSWAFCTYVRRCSCTSIVYYHTQDVVLSLLYTLVAAVCCSL